MTNDQLRERLDDLRIQRNFIERTMSGLAPDADSGMHAEWAEAMGRLARMHGGIMDLMVKAGRGEIAAN